ncbi:peptidylprolyl isomerase [Nitrosomonas sp. HPC101]|uniref:peptidyl-prolyl cis-trans isomerase n=1 Tax=Nitrosomonas sp. HPC101 TaxID=1658667 RepID=UPI00136B32A0|nr:peptidyl-prolyl cis-trans isomerase [Nitrosomonas sp. HPC101]MXS86450.1 peptidylprolyl isomerase [Nitrosomonas sp. HPC101]
MRLVKFFCVPLAVLGFACVTPLSAQSGGTVAKVNGIAIPQARLDLVVKAAAAQGQPDSAEMRNALRENLITEEILTQEAIKKKLDRNPDVVTQIDLARQGILIRAYQTDFMKNNPVSDSELRKEYESVKSQMGDKEYKARHILVETEQEAKDLIVSLRKGGAFEKLADERSIDTGSKSNGGELGWSSAAVYVKPFADALTKLKKGETTNQPIQTPFGWHVIRLDDMRTAVPPSFDEVKQNMQQRVLQRKFAAVVELLRKNAKVE